MSAEIRPISPHIQIYRWLWTMFFSIVHRATGVALSVGALVLLWWLIALAQGPELFSMTQAMLGSVVGRIFLLGWTWSLYFHLFNGIRHIAWDIGLGFGLPIARLTGWIVMVSSIIATLVTWGCGYMILGNLVS